MKPSRLFAATLIMLVASVVPATAQQLSYTPGTVWNISNIQVEPGQMQHYLDFLAGDWKKVNEFGKKEGYIVSYHVFSVNNPRNGEPDLILAVEYKDYYTNAQQLAQQKESKCLSCKRRTQDGESVRGAQDNA